ncbi:MAG: RNA pseudouridine synthase [Chitinophagaceae bacterium]
MNLSKLIIAENENWVVLNKPSGLLSIPDRKGLEPSLKSLLLEKFEIIFTVHRLDKETSGIILFAKNEAMHKHLSMQFEKRTITKKYTGLVIGSPTEKSGQINKPITAHHSKKGQMVVHHSGKDSITDYTVVEDFGICSLVDFQIHSGRTHQIRVHMKELGHPIVCDSLYGDGKPIFISSLKKKYNLSKDELAERPILNRLALHARQLSFSDLSTQIFTLEAPLHKDMKATLQQLRKRMKPVK